MATVGVKELKSIKPGTIEAFHCDGAKMFAVAAAISTLKRRGMIQDRYMDVVEVSQFLHMPISSVYQSKIPRRRVGKRLLFSEREVRKWLSE